jgi:hypothetical protein
LASTLPQSAGTEVAGMSTPELERWSFTFRQIQVQDTRGNTTFRDVWA